jgi:UDP-N-acetylmuramoyl-tripeptide--D-alanyl-D-alanine ligase
VANPLWTICELVQATGAKSYAAPDTAVTGVSIDSRTVAPRECFVAIRGANRDGHAFIVAALGEGAACAIVDKGFAAQGNEGKLLRVADTLEALRELGVASRRRLERGVVIGVTGSVGKTGTKEALKLALGASGSVHVSAKSHNNHWGVPLSLANMRRGVAFAVFEVGMNHAGEILNLTKLIRPHIAIVTTVEPVHLGFFRSVAEIADAKAEIFAGLKPNGTAVLNRDNPYFDRLRRHALSHEANVVGFGEARDADARLLSATLHADGSDVEADILGECVRYHLGAPGRHFVQNSLAVLAAAKLARASLGAAASALSKWQAQTGRGERLTLDVPGGQLQLIDETYNANPASMRAALAALALVPRNEFPRRVAVLGDMLELGGQGPRLHLELKQDIDAAGVDVVFACGELMGGLYAALPRSRQGGYTKTAAEIAPLLASAVAVGDVVMIKGSFGSRMAPLVEALQRHFLTAGVQA